MQSNSAAMSASISNSLNYPQNPNLVSFLPVSQTAQQPNLLSSPQSNQQNIIQTNFISQQQVNQKDTTFTKIFVGGLPYHTTDESLKIFFQKFGNIEEAVVITDRQTGKSRGYGFVIMQTKEAADAALFDPNPIIDGRKANINLACLGIKPKVIPPKNLIPMTIGYQLPINTTETIYGYPPVYFNTLGANPNFLNQPAFLQDQNLLLSASNPQISPLTTGLNNSTALIDFSSPYNSPIAALNSNQINPFQNTNHLANVTTNPFVQFNNSPLSFSNRQTLNQNYFDQTQSKNGYLTLSNT